MSSTQTITHAELVRRAERWAREFKYHRVLTEPTLGVLDESPDVIAWRYKGDSMVIECKVSRSDFQADRQKPHRHRAGMGDFRYYLCPEGLIEPHEIDDEWGWGLLWLDEQTDQPVIKKRAEQWREHAINRRAEVALLLASLRHTERAAGTTAQEARPSQRTHFPKKLHPQVQRILAEHEMLDTKAIIRAIPEEELPPKYRRNKGLASTHLGKAARANEIPNVQVVLWGYPTTLSLKGGDSDG